MSDFLKDFVAITMFLPVHGRLIITEKKHYFYLEELRMIWENRDENDSNKKNEVTNLSNS